MKQYYIFIKNEQLGPFFIEELKTKNISRDTKVWFEGLDDWKNASELDELTTILFSIPPTMNSFSSKPPTPRFESNQKVEIETELEKETPKIFGLKQNLFYLLIASFTIIIGLFYLNNVKESRRNEIEKQNQQTENNNQQLEKQKKVIEEQNSILAKQEKIESQRIAKEKKLAIENRIIEIQNLLETDYQNLEKAKKNLNGASTFQLLRSSSERNEQINSAQDEIDYYKDDVKKLEAELEKINH